LFLADRWTERRTEGRMDGETDRQTDRRVDMRNLIDDFRNFANGPNTLTHFDCLLKNERMIMYGIHN
jgi:hypothetical protein